MTRSKFLASAIVGGTLLALSTAPAQAWETSTHVGLAEQAALAADLDAWLRDLGLSGAGRRDAENRDDRQVGEQHQTESARGT